MLYHRAQGYWADRLEYVKSELQREILQAIADGCTHFISGFAEGVDLLFTSIVTDPATENPVLTLEAAISRDRIKTIGARFHRLLAKCSVVGFHSEAYGLSCLIKCNRFMILQAQRVIVICDGREKGETFFTMRYAYSRKRDVWLITI